MQVKKDPLTSPEIIQLLQEHLNNMLEITPSESVHALDLSGLRAPEISFWSVWQNNELLGCGALKELDKRTGEVKSMRTKEQHRGKGVASTMLEHIISEATKRNYTQLHLETGAFPEFEKARALYTKYGFEYRDAFGDYTNDPNSVFMTKKL